MRPLAFALIVLSIQGIVAWDMRDWSDRWWKQDTTPIKHKHHKHYRHHHHRTQLCQPVGLTTTTTATTIPQATFQPISSISGGQEEKPPPLLSGGGGLEEDLPPSINGNLTSTGTDCGTSLTTLAYGRFNAIFFGNFITTEAHEIIGPLAVGGDFSGHSYTVNTQHGSDCTDLRTSFAGYALIVGKNDVGYTYDDVHVHGAVFLPSGTDKSNVQQLDGACPVYNDQGNGLMDFRMVQVNAVIASMEFSYMEPTLHLSSDGTLTRIGTSSTGFDVITFGTCNTCSYPADFSSPDAIYYGIGNWNGPMGISWPERLIINVPVVKNTTITIQGNQPSLGMNVCSTLLNFYPSDETGAYIPGSFQVDRTTGGRIGGFFLMPEGDIIDENRGAFAGQVIANNYQWQGSGIEIQDYKAAGGSCLTTDICVPVYTDAALIDVPGEGDTESSSSEESSSDSSSTESSSSEESSSDDISSSSNETTSDSGSISSSSSELSSSSESSSSQSRSREDISSSTESSESTNSDSGLSSSNVQTDSNSVESSTSNPSNTSEQSSSAMSVEVNSGTTDQVSSSESFSDSISSTLSGNSISESTEISSYLGPSSDPVYENSDSSSNSSPFSTNSVSSIASSSIASSSVASSSISLSDQSDSSISTETSTECHTHHHHVTTTQYQCDQGFIHVEEVLACEHDNHHHHRKDYYTGDDDDNFENDVEFGLYDYDKFDEECDIDHGVVNYDEDEYEYKYYKYKGKKHHDVQDDEEEDDDDDDDDDEEENEKEDDDYDEGHD